jgi:hypothetical protein
MKLDNTLFVYQDQRGSQYEPIVKVWINEDLPYPIKQEMRNLITEKETEAPPSSKFELVEIGQGSPKVDVPEFAGPNLSILVGVANAMHSLIVVTKYK